MLYWIVGFIFLFVKLALVLVALMLAAAYLTWFERKLLARFQVRFGPNRAGPYGLWQPFADIIKMVTKEDAVPEGADRILFLYAPAVVAVTSMLIFAVIPFGEGFTLGTIPVPMVILDLNVGVLYAFALISLGVYGVVLGGWASNSKYSLLGGVRAAAQMVSYELPLVLSVIPIVMRARSFSLVDIVNAQAGCPFVLVEPVAFVIFFISAAAEIKRIPFDLPEAENELVAGYHTEYSGMRFGIYFVGEYISLIVLGSFIAVFFWGGWHGWLLPPLVWFILKVMIIVFFLILMRATLPRLRYDQLMQIGWKVLIPLSLVNIVVTGMTLVWRT
jgi:NADH-quinone oxidoreductase subunit H